MNLVQCRVCRLLNPPDGGGYHEIVAFLPEGLASKGTQLVRDGEPRWWVVDVYAAIDTRFLQVARVLADFKRNPNQEPGA